MATTESELTRRAREVLAGLHRLECEVLAAAVDEGEIVPVDSFERDTAEFLAGRGLLSFGGVYSYAPTDLGRECVRLSELTRQARQVLAGLDPIDRESVRLGACEPTPGGIYRHHTLQIAGLVWRERVHVPEDEGGPASVLVWRFTDLGHECGRLLRSESGAE